MFYNEEQAWFLNHVKTGNLAIVQLIAGYDLTPPFR